MRGLTVTSWCNPAEGMGDCFTSIVKLDVKTVLGDSAGLLV